MSESDSNSERSYDSDIFRVQFIPGYVNIGDIEVEDNGNLGDITMGRQGRTIT